MPEYDQEDEVCTDLDTGKMCKKFPDWMAKMEAERAEFEARPFHRRLPRYVCDFFRWKIYEPLRPSEIHWKTKRFVQRKIWGFATYDLFSLDFHLIELILPRLRAFRKMKKWGIPADCDENGEIIGPMQTEEDWNAVLDKMLFAFELLNEERNYPFALKNDPPERHEEVRKVEEGMELFHKYFFSLWD